MVIVPVIKTLIIAFKLTTSKITAKIRAKLWGCFIITIKASVWTFKKVCIHVLPPFIIVLIKVKTATNVKIGIC